MTAPAWMPLYVADYLADTGHLSTVEHGAYMLLIMHYWQNSGLPGEDTKLARIARMNLKEWLSIRDTIADLFAEDWRHKRIDEEIANTAETIDKRSAAGRAAGLASAAARRRTAQRPLNETTDDGSTDVGRSSTPSPTPPPLSNSEPKGSARLPLPDPERDLFTRGKVVLGKEAGGLITKLLKAKNGEIALARAAIEQASVKENPREYIGAIIRGRDPPPDEQRWDPRL